MQIRPGYEELKWKVIRALVQKAALVASHTCTGNGFSSQVLLLLLRCQYIFESKQLLIQCMCQNRQ